MTRSCFSVAYFLLFISLAAQTLVWASPCEKELTAIQSTRFEKPIEELRKLVSPETIKTKGVDAIIDEMEKNDARNALFRLEGLLRVYDGIYGKSFRRMRVEFKRIEDLVGQYTEKLEFLEYAETLGVPPQVLQEIKKDRDHARAELAAEIPLLPEAFTKLEKMIGKVDWSSPKADRKLVLEEIATELKKHEQLDYDVTELQSGVHELRRNLRWILIYCQSLDGLIQIENGAGKLNEYSYLATHPIAKSKFSKLDPNPRIKNPVLIPQGYFLALSKLVNELNDIKSSGENVEALSEALLTAKLASSKSDAHKAIIALARAKDPKFADDTETAATRILDELRRTDLLRKIRKLLANQQ